jgi:hypothetical protein
MNRRRRYEAYPDPEVRPTLGFWGKFTIARALLRVGEDKTFEKLSSRLPTVEPHYFTLWTQLLMQEYLHAWSAYRGMNGLEYYVVVEPVRNLYLPISVQEKYTATVAKRFSWNGEVLPPDKRIDKGVMHYAFNAGAEAAIKNPFSASEVQMIHRVNTLIEGSAAPHLAHVRKEYAEALDLLATRGSNLHDTL